MGYPMTPDSVEEIYLSALLAPGHPTRTGSPRAQQQRSILKILRSREKLVDQQCRPDAGLHVSDKSLSNCMRWTSIRQSCPDGMLRIRLISKGQWKVLFECAFLAPGHSLENVN